MLFQNFIEPKNIDSNYRDIKNGFSVRVPPSFNFTRDVVDVYAKNEPERRAIVWCDDDSGAVDADGANSGANSGAKTFNFKELSEASAQTAHFLTSLGIKKGDAVLLILRRRYEFWFFLLALHKIGAVAVPATNMLLAVDIEYRVDKADIKLIVTLDDSNLQTEVEKAVFGPGAKSGTKPKLVTIGRGRDNWICFDNKKFAPVWTHPEGEDAIKNDDTMLIYFTSGTSGYPKMVSHNFTYPLGHIVTAKYWHNVMDGGLHLTVAETGWAKAMWGKIYGQWLCGSAVFVYDMLSFKPPLLLEKMSRYGVTTFCAPPTVYRYLVRQNLSSYNLSALKSCTTAGEALEALVAKKWQELTGHVIREGFGQTETTLMAGTFNGMEVKRGSIGKAAPGYNIDIVDADGVSCAVGVPGEIVLRLDKGRPFGMFSGYYHDEEQTKAAFKDGIYHTGDTAWLDADDYIWFLGRIDDMIKSSGYRISPFEVESILIKHPAVLECAVTGVADIRRGQAVKASIILAEGWEPNPAISRELQDFVRKNTAAYKFPRIIEFVDFLPKTISGKIRRAAIRALSYIPSRS